MGRPSKQEQGSSENNRRLTGAETEERPQAKRTRAAVYDTYTADDYEPGPDEWDDVHVMIECRNFDPNTGKRLSAERRYITNPQQFLQFQQYRNGFSINKILHRPATVAPFEVDSED